MGESTRDLTEELRKREGITSIAIAPYENAKIITDHGVNQLTGPAIIIINQD